MRGVIISNLYANVQGLKRDMHIFSDMYYYITTECDYAKRDSRLAYEEVVLQRFEFVKENRQSTLSPKF